MTDGVKLDFLVLENSSFLVQVGPSSDCKHRQCLRMFTRRTETNWDSGQTKKLEFSGFENSSFLGLKARVLPHSLKIAMWCMD